MCTAEMELKHDSKLIARRTNKVRIRRYKCPICDYNKTIFGNGRLDEELIPSSGINDVNRIFKQEEINRYYDNNTDNRGYASLQGVEEISPEWDN